MDRGDYNIPFAFLKKRGDKYGGGVGGPRSSNYNAIRYDSYLLYLCLHAKFQ